MRASGCPRCVGGGLAKHGTAPLVDGCLASLAGHRDLPGGITSPAVLTNGKGKTETGGTGGAAGWNGWGGCLISIPATLAPRGDWHADRGRRTETTEAGVRLLLEWILNTRSNPRAGRVQLCCGLLVADFADRDVREVKRRCFFLGVSVVCHGMCGVEGAGFLRQ